MFIAWCTIRQNRQKEEMQQAQDSMTRVQYVQHTRSANQVGRATLHQGAQSRAIPPPHPPQNQSFIALPTMATWQSSYRSWTVLWPHPLLIAFTVKQQRHQRHLQKLQKSPPHSTIDVVHTADQHTFLVQLYPDMNKEIVPSPTKLNRAREPALDHEPRVPKEEKVWWGCLS